MKKNKELDLELKKLGTLQAQRWQEGEDARKAQEEAFRKANVSPAGAIPNLPPLLEARRLKYSIPDEYFRAMACNNRINVFQLDADEGDTYGDGIIHKTDRAKEVSIQQTPKGILLGGGLKALDHMYSNGYWIGHIVNFIQMNPWRKPIQTRDGKKKYVLVMTCGDITDSEDLAHYIRAGIVKPARREFVLADKTTTYEHYLQDTKTEGVWDPSTAVMLDEEKET